MSLSHYERMEGLQRPREQLDPRGAFYNRPPASRELEPA